MVFNYVGDWNFTEVVILVPKIVSTRLYASFVKRNLYNWIYSTVKLKLKALEKNFFSIALNYM